MPIDQRTDEAGSLTYTTAPLTEEVEVIGNPVALRYVSSTADTAYFHVKVCDVTPDGTSKLVTQGGLNATHRASHSQPELLEPGAVYELRIDLLSVAYRFASGHRMRVSIASADFQNAWPVSQPAVNAVYRCILFPSRVILPVAPPPPP